MLAEQLKAMEVLRKRKVKNEGAVPMEILTTKYKAPYEKLCADLNCSRASVKTTLLQISRAFVNFASEVVYCDTSDEMVALMSTAYKNCNNETLLRLLMECAVEYYFDVIGEGRETT